jgi:hypothetical protein
MRRRSAMLRKKTIFHALASKLVKKSPKALGTPSPAYTALRT